MVTQSVMRSLEVLERVAELQPVRLSELDSAIDLPKSTIQRNLQTLAEAGWIDALDNDSPPRWQVAPRVVNLFARKALALDLRRAAREPMLRLRDATGLTVQLAVPSTQQQLVILDKVEADRSEPTTGHIGTAMPKASTSAGVAMLARSSDEVIREVVSAQPDLDLETLWTLVRSTRELGFCTRVHPPSLVSYVSAAIVDTVGGVAGTLTLGVTPDTPAEVAQEWALLTIEAAQETALSLARSHGA